MKMIPDRVNEAGRIFRIDSEGASVNDLLSCELVEVAPDSHILTLGRVCGNYELHIMETMQTIQVDELDAVILEITSVEIA